MDPSFGARLRLQRERQQIAISTIAAETKISPSMLEGLERDDVSHWPEGIFRRAYVRAYARAIGLDPDAVVREFLALHPDSVEVLPAGSRMWPEPGHESERPPSARRLGWMVTSAMAAVPAVLRGSQKSAPASERPAAFARPGPIEGLRADPDFRRGSNDRTVEHHSDRPVEHRILRPEPGLSAIADVCTGIGRAVDAREVVPLLAEAARILDAVGLIVWFSDARATALLPSLAHGYSDAVLARLASVPTDADNAVAAAFRSAAARVVEGDGVTSAVVVPLIGPGGCVGVLALELAHGSERRDSVRAFATILAAQLVTAPRARSIAPVTSAGRPR
jgi:transcriptional regulator with XRE-family HTH domain